MSTIANIPFRARLVAIVLLLAHVGLFSWCALRKSICIDEGAHLAAGVAYWRWHELSIYDLSPPLMRYWDALPAYLAHPSIPAPKVLRDEAPSSRHWIYYERFQEQNLHHLHRYVLMGRFMQLPISIALALGILLTAQGMYGGWGGIIACGVYCLDPLVIASASTIGTDLAIAAALFAVVVAWLRFLETRNKLPLLLCALAVGAAHAIKFNALLIWPVLLAMVFVMKRPREGLTGLIVLLISCYLIVNLSYGFQLWGRPMSWFHFQSRLMQGVAKVLPDNLRVPFPQFMVEGFDAQKYEAEGAYVSVLFGKARFGGDWRYYPFVLLCRTPLAEIVLIVCCIASFVTRGRGSVRAAFAQDAPGSDGGSPSRGRRREIAFILLACAVLIGMGAATRINIGLRYLLPAYPPIMVLIGRVKNPRWMALIALLAIEVLIAAPHFQTYANVAAPKSKLPDQDWGQSLIDLRGWMRHNNVNKITLVSAGWTDPAVYDINARPLDRPRAKFVAVSKLFLEGIPMRSRDKFLFVRNWRELRHTKPIADLGGIVVFPKQALGPDPWISQVHSWQEAAQDPAILPVENLTEREKLFQ